MKKFLFVLLLMFTAVLMIGCNDKKNEDNKDKEPVYANSDLKYLLCAKNEELQSYINTSEYQNFISLVSNFSTDLTEKAYLKYNSSYDRMAISPISIYMALAMATATAKTDAQEELSKMFNIPYETLVAYSKYLYSSLNKEKYDHKGKLSCRIELNNSIWLNENLSYKQEGLDLLKDAFYVDSYAAPFTTNNKAANKAVQDYVYRNTHGLINNEYGFDEETLFLLINTLYLKDAWNLVGNDLPFTENYYDFKNINNTTNSTKLLKGHYSYGRTQQGDGFEYFYSSTANGMKLYFIKPTTKNLEDIYTNDNLNMILTDNDYNYRDEELKEEYYTRCFFPEFNASFNEDLSSLFKEEYGITKIFRSDVANYDKVTDEKCFTSAIVHQTKLIVDKTGIEGAAVTIVANDSTSIPEPYTKIFSDFVLDKSFGFLLTYNDVVLFSGVVNNL